MLRGTFSYDSFKPLGFPLGVKARIDELNSSGIDWRYKLSRGIGLLFRLNIVASKEYCLTIMVRRLLVDTLLQLAAPAVS